MREVIVTLPRLMTAKDMAEVLGLHPASMCSLARTGQMWVIHLGRAMRFDPGRWRSGWPPAVPPRGEVRVKRVHPEDQ
jgi:hypothetical protein